jgi:hypothetical protein
MIPNASSVTFALSLTHKNIGIRHSYCVASTFFLENIIIPKFA